MGYQQHDSTTQTDSPRERLSPRDKLLKELSAPTLPADHLRDEEGDPVLPAEPTWYGESETSIKDALAGLHAGDVDAIEDPLATAAELWEEGYAPTQLRVWCRYCQAWHYHGTGLDGEDQHWTPERIAYGPRRAECWVEWSPYRRTGYVLIPGRPDAPPARERESVPPPVQARLDETDVAAVMFDGRPPDHGSIEVPLHDAVERIKQAWPYLDSEHFPNMVVWEPAYAGARAVAGLSLDVFEEAARFVWYGPLAPRPAPHGGDPDQERIRRRIVPAGDFILDEPAVVPAVWGADERTLWAQGEALMIAGGDGVGKTTLAQQIVLRRLGVLDSDFLGLPVAASERRVLYLAMDRPRQAARSFRRMIRPEHRDVLNERLVIWQGPLPFDLTKEPERLTEFIADQGDVGDVVIDSLKDIAPGISKDEVGQQINSAIQGVIAEGVEVLTLHHQRKASAENKHPDTLADVYGSRWLTAGHGSVLFIDGEAGAETVELLHHHSCVFELGR